MDNTRQINKSQVEEAMYGPYQLGGCHSNGPQNRHLLCYGTKMDHSKVVIDELVLHWEAHAVDRGQRHIRPLGSGPRYL